MSEILARIGPLPVYTFGLSLGLGFLLAALVAIREGRRREIDPERMGDFLALGIVVGLLGARAVFVALNRQYYRTFPWEILLLQDGGLSFYGAVPAVILLAWAWQREAGAFYRLLDALAPGVALGSAVALVGSDLFGLRADLPWSVTSPAGVAVHPLQVYWMLALYGLFIVLWRRRREVRFDGEQFFLWLLADAFIRLAAGFLREGERFWGLGYDQWAALLAAGVGILWLRHRLQAQDLREGEEVRYPKRRRLQPLEAVWWGLGLAMLVFGFYLRLGRF